MSTSLSELIGQTVVAGGGLALIVYQVFKHMAAKWLEARFAAQLEEIKHKQMRELEQLRFRINTLLDRSVKLSAKEFDILPDAWAKLHTSFWEARAQVSPLQTYPDLERMASGQLDVFLAGCPLQDWQKAEIRSAEDKNDLYQKHIYWERLGRVMENLRDTNMYLAKVCVFMPPALRAQFMDLAELMFNAVSEDRFNHEHDLRPLQRQDIDLFMLRGESKLKALEDEVHSRLWPDERSTAEHLERA